MWQGEPLASERLPRFPPHRPLREHITDVTENSAGPFPLPIHLIENNSEKLNGIKYRKKHGSEPDLNPEGDTYSGVCPASLILQV